MKYTRDTDGKTGEFSFDYSAIADAEGAGYSLIDDIDNAAQNKFSAVVRLANLLDGSDYQRLILQGWTFADVVKIIVGCIGELGFTSAPAD